jgi:Transposase domain (DUF772)
MQGFERMDREFTDAELLAGHLVPAGSMFAFLAAHRAEVFPDADYPDLSAAFGRPSLPATRMAAVLALQALHDFPDRETAEAVRFDVRWKAACGLAIDDQGFDPSSLVYWRGRIARSERPHRVNEAIRLIVEQSGVLKGRRRRAVDSTILADAVATRTRSPSWSPRSGGWRGRCPARRSRSRRCAPAMITASRVSRRSTGMTRPRRTRWSLRWSATRTRWWPRSGTRN